MYMETWNAHRVVRPSRLANAVIERLLLRILDGEFQPNGDLPPEAALAQEFAVSRTILREALKALEEKRVLRIRHGRGTTVRPKADWNILDPLVLSVLLEYGGSPTLATELHEVRAAVQVLMADLAARRGTPEQREKLDAAMVRMRHCAASGADEHGYRDAAHGFACVLAEAAGNEVARCVVETIDLPFAYDGGSVGAGVPEDRAGGRGSMAKTQEFAEFLYARVLRGASAAGTPNESDASDKSDESADPPAVGVALPGQAVTRAAQEHRVGDLRAVMVGAGH